MIAEWLAPVAGLAGDGHRGPGGGGFGLLRRYLVRIGQDILGRQNPGIVLVCSCPSTCPGGHMKCWRSCARLRAWHLTGTKLMPVSFLDSDPEEM